MTPPPMMARGLAVAAVVLLLLTGCSVPARLAAVPQDETTRAQIPGIPNARYFPDTRIDLLAAEALAARNRETAALARNGHVGPPPETNLLAVSGEGADGAFGAGLLTGWTQAGTRGPSSSWSPVSAPAR
jgi:hypothetical protein